MNRSVAPIGSDAAAAGQARPWLGLAALLLALAGIIVPTSGGSHNRREQQGLGGLVAAKGGLYLATWLAIPLLIGGLLLARDRTVFAETRYFIFLVRHLAYNQKQRKKRFVFFLLNNRKSL